MPTGTSFIPLDVLINCVSPCLMFLRLTVRCAAYAAWTTPGLVKTDKTCVKLTCLYGTNLFPKVYTSPKGPFLMLSPKLLAVSGSVTCFRVFLSVIKFASTTGKHRCHGSSQRALTLTWAECQGHLFPVSFTGSTKNNRIARFCDVLVTLDVTKQSRPKALVSYKELGKYFLRCPRSCSLAPQQHRGTRYLYGCH